MPTAENQFEEPLIEKRQGLEYEHRPEIRDRDAMEQNFRDKFEAQNRVKLTDAEFQWLLEEIITPVVFKAARILRQRNDKFVAKCTLVRMVSRYMVPVARGQKLLIMRPHQIYAVKTSSSASSRTAATGTCWHTTSSGKTLTPFEASTLLMGLRDIEKCLFVVDRKDLDRQTREEFNRFQEGCVEENTSINALVRRL